MYTVKQAMANLSDDYDTLIAQIAAMEVNITEANLSKAKVNGYAEVIKAAKNKLYGVVRDQQAYISLE